MLIFARSLLEAFNALMDELAWVIYCMANVSRLHIVFLLFVAVFTFIQPCEILMLGLQ